MQLFDETGAARLQTIELVSTLVDQNLLIRLNESGSGRYRMLGSIRDFGQAQLVAENEDATIRARFAGTVLARIAPPESASQDDVVWLERVERSMDDARVAFAWLLANGESARALQMAIDLGGWWSTRGNPREGHRMYAAAFAADPDVSDSQRFDALRDYAWLLALDRRGGAGACPPGRGQPAGGVDWRPARRHQIGAAARRAGLYRGELR